ncbi:MAG: hypothetical protein HY331_17380, partial [Chloroflexi bacterium]|nr:hypothetical protein [Chloroflexota bacterium]
MATPVIRHPSVRAAAVVLVVAAAGLALAIQGWRARTPTFDLVSPILSAHALVSQGVVPDRGTLSGFGSFIPPGTSWLLAPGVLLFRDPRLYEFVGGGLLYVGTLVGLLLLVRACFGMRCAALSVLFYGLSGTGLYFAGSLWPRGHPFFFVWMVYWIVRWVQQRNPSFAAAAIATWAAGMYVFMELAPAVAVLGVAWLLYRPPIRPLPILIAVGLAAVLWLPYLRFEATRGFADVRSQVLREAMYPRNDRDTWCDPGLTIQALSLDQVEQANAGSGIGRGLRALVQPFQGADPWLSLFDGFLSNFEQMTPFPGAPALGLFAVLTSLVALGAPPAGVTAAVNGFGERIERMA